MGLVLGKCSCSVESNADGSDDEFLEIAPGCNIAVRKGSTNQDIMVQRSKESSNESHANLNETNSENFLLESLYQTHDSPDKDKLKHGTYCPRRCWCIGGKRNKSKKHISFIGEYSSNSTIGSIDDDWSSSAYDTYWEFLRYRDGH